MSRYSRNGVSLLALSRTFLPIMVAGIGFAAPAHAQLLCGPLLNGVVNCDGGDPGILVNVVDAADPITVTLQDGFETINPVTITSLPGADVTLDAVGSALIDTVGAPGLSIDSGADLTARITDIATEGDGATGALLRALDQVVFTADDVVSTVGDAADGINIEGGSISVDSNIVQTSGSDSDGVELVSLEGPVSLTSDLIETDGDLSAATLIRAVGDVDVNAGVLRTNGSQALGADISTDAAACVLLGDQGCGVTMAADEITTNGFGGIGALVSAAGTTGIDIDVLQTGGDEAAGLDLSADPDACVALGVGACDTGFTVGELTTTGDRSPGALVRAVGDITADVGILRTDGEDAIGLDLASNPDACATLGAGACDTSFSVGELTTSGAGATGLLARVTGATTGNVGLLETAGDNANGIDIAADPAACVLLGAGACDIGLVADQVTTSGDGALGVILRAPANIVTDLGLVSTSGDGATGLGIFTDPVLCLTLGAGACSIDASVGDVDTGGDDAPGVDVGGDGPIDVDVGDVDTDGDNSPGVNVDGGDDPIDIDVGTVDTDGDNSPGVDVSGDGPISVDVDDIDTGGTNSPGVAVDGGEGDIDVGAGTVHAGGDSSTGIDVDGDGAIDVDAGTVDTDGNGSDGIDVTGGDGPIDVDAGTVTTGGDDSTGVDVSGTGPIDIGAGTVTTGGNGSTGVEVDGGEGPISVDFDDISTSGDDAPGLDVSGTGPIDITGGDVTTGGMGSTGIIATGDDDSVTVDVGAIATGGDDADGIDLTTGTGDQQISAGPITTIGDNSDGISASSGCANIAITARGPIRAQGGTGILASSDCTVDITTLEGASVFGEDAGIAVMAGTGSTITIGDAVSSGSGPAIDVDGGPADVLITETGSVDGRVDLTDADDSLTNNGLFNAMGDSDFGAGNDAFVNNGVLMVRPDADAPGTVAFTGLETTTNSGLIDLRNGQAGDRLTLVGDFVGEGDSSLGLDIDPGAGGAGDRLVVAGDASGSTRIQIEDLGTEPGLLVNDLVLVDAGTGSDADAFSLSDQGTITNGLVDYALAFDPADGTFALYGTPSASAYELSKVSEGARQIFYRTNDVVAGHLQASGSWAAMDQTPRRSSAFWGQFYGTYNKYDRDIGVSPFGQARTITLNYSQDMFGGQIGYDFAGDSATIIGVTAGYTNSNMRFSRTTDQFNYDAANVGVYGRLEMGPVFLNALAKYEHYWLDISGRRSGLSGKADGNGYGGLAELGVHLGSDSFFVEPLASIEVARTDMEGIDMLGSSFDFDTADGVRGKAGARVGAVLSTGPSKITLYGGGAVVHEFEGKDLVDFSNNGQTLRFRNPRIGTYGQAKLGVTIATSGNVTGFIEGQGDFGDDYKGGGGRVGLSIRF